MRLERLNRRVIAWSWLITGSLSAGYVGWTMLARRLANRPPVRTNEAVPREPSDTAVRITQFYPNTFEVVRGERAILCYGVANARAVRLEPPVEKLYLTPNRCIWVEPERTTTYTIVAEGPDGKQIRERCEIRVKPPPPSILFVELNADRIHRGQPVILCYGVKNSVAVKIEPAVASLVPSEKHCIRFFPVRTGEYTLTATGDGNRTDHERFRITVE